MPRKGPAPQRDILPDPKYHDLVVTKFINMMMDGGKKGVSRTNSLWSSGHSREADWRRIGRDFSPSA